MIEVFQTHAPRLWLAFGETNLMMGITMFVCLVTALPLGILLYSLQMDFLLKQRLGYQLLSISLNALRSVPFLIFIFILIPVSRAIFGSSFGNLPATLPLSLVALSLYARFVEQALLNCPEAVIQRAISMGADRRQIIRYFLLPAVKKDLVLSFTSVTISILSYSTVIGVIGAGGLGEYAFRYGYQEYNYPLMYLIVLLFIVYVFVLQSVGYLAARYINRG